MIGHLVELGVLAALPPHGREKRPGEPGFVECLAADAGKGFATGLSDAIGRSDVQSGLARGLVGIATGVASTVAK